MKTLFIFLFSTTLILYSTHDTAQEVKTFSKHLSSVWGVDFSPDGKSIVSASGDRNLKVWNISAGNFTILSGHKATVWDTKYTPSGKYILSSSADYSIKMWDVKTLKNIYSFEGHEWDVNSIDISKDAKLMVSCSTDKTIKVWDLVNRRLIKTLRGHNGSVNKVLFSPDNKKLVSCSGDKTLKIWNLSTGKILHTLRGHTDLISTVVYSTDGRYIISAGWDNHIRIWDANTGQLQNDILCSIDPDANYCINSLTFTKNKKYVICSCSDFFTIQSQIILINTETKEIKKILPLPVNQVNTIKISPSGKELLGAMENGTIKLWDISNIY